MQLPKSVEEMQAGIDALNLDAIKIKLLDPKEGKGWSREYADQMEIAYKRFLLLSVKYPEMPTVPTTDIDTFWHYHILDTMKYAEDCQNIFGFFLHHFPYMGMRGEEDAANLQKASISTHELYEKEFGEAMRLSLEEDAARCTKSVESDLGTARCTKSVESDLGTARCTKSVESDSDTARCTKSVNAWQISRDITKTHIRPTFAQ